MKNVVTLITNPSDNKLSEIIINKAFIALEKSKRKIIDIAWLGENEACDIIFDGNNLLEEANILSEKLKETKVDIIVQNNNNRKKKLLITDMDSTIIEQECIDEIANELGIKQQVAQITEQAMNGKIDFSESLRKRVALLKNLDETKLTEVYNNKISLMPGAKELVSTMKENGAYCVLVSGGFTFFTSKILHRLSFDEASANILEIKNKKLTGNVTEPVLDSSSKLDVLNKTIKKLNITSDDVIAVGDGANDIPMLKNSGIGIAFHAKPLVQEQLQYKINHTKLKSLLYIQGYKKTDFIN
jgi:phosphoserine phosphatase